MLLSCRFAQIISLLPSPVHFKCFHRSRLTISMMKKKSFTVAAVVIGLLTMMAMTTTVYLVQGIYCTRSRTVYNSSVHYIPFLMLCLCLISPGFHPIKPLLLLDHPTIFTTHRKLLSHRKINYNSRIFFRLLIN